MAKNPTKAPSRKNAQLFCINASVEIKKDGTGDQSC